MKKKDVFIKRGERSKANKHRRSPQAHKKRGSTDCKGACPGSTCIKETSWCRRRQRKTEKGTLSKFGFSKGNQSLASNYRGKHLGSGTYGSCYLGSYRRLDVVVKQLKVKKHSGETQGDAEMRVHN